MKVELKQKKKAFTMISNVIAKDTNLSLKAKGMSLIIAHFPSDWTFYEEKLQDYTSDGRTAIANAIKELEDAAYLYREQLRKKGRYSNKVWIFSDEGLTENDILELCTDCRKPDIGKSDIGKTVTSNTHSTNIKESNKKNTQKKGRKKSFYKFVNTLKSHVLEYPNLKVVFEDVTYSFLNINGRLLLKNEASDIVLSKVHAEKLYQKMANSLNVKIVRGER